MSQNINLYNPSLREQRNLVNAHLLLILVGLMIVSMVALTGWLEWTARGLEQQVHADAEQLKQGQEQLLGLTRSVSEYQPDAKLADALRQAERLLTGRTELARLMESGTLGRTQGFSAQLRAFARQSLEGVWLTGFHINADRSEMEIDGRTLNAELLPVYIRRLNSEQIFQGQHFSALNMKNLIEETAVKANPTTEIKVEEKGETSGEIIREARGRREVSAAPIPVTTIAFNLSGKARSGETGRP